MRAKTLLVMVTAQILGLAPTFSSSHAIDLGGAWATDAKVCEKMFARKGKSISFRPDAEVHGGGFIIEGNTIRARATKCAIRTRKEDGAILHLMAACATDIMLSHVQFSLRVVNENKVLRIFPGMEGMELGYDRCPF